MKAVIHQDRKYYPKQDLLPQGTMVTDYKCVWRNHCLLAINFTFGTRTYCIFAPDVTFIH